MFTILTIFLCIRSCSYRVLRTDFMFIYRTLKLVTSDYYFLKWFLILISSLIIWSWIHRYSLHNKSMYFCKEKTINFKNPKLENEMLFSLLSLNLYWPVSYIVLYSNRLYLSKNRRCLEAFLSLKKVLKLCRNKPAIISYKTPWHK